MSFTPSSSFEPAVVTVAGNVSVSNFPASQAVTGPLTDAQLRAAAVPVSAASLPLPAGAAKDSTLTDGTARIGGTVTVDGSGHTQPVSGSVGVSNFPATQPISAVALPLPTGAAKDSTLTDGTARIGGTVTVDGSGHTQPVSATALPLPAGAAKDSTLTDGTQRVGGTVTTDGSGHTQPVSGPLTATELAAAEPLSVTGPLTAAQLVAAEPLSVTGPLTAAQLTAAEPLAVSGPLTDTQLRATAVAVDGSAHTQPISATDLPLPDGAADNSTLSEVALTAIQQRERMAVT